MLESIPKISGYQSGCPDGTVVLRAYVPGSMAAYSVADDPAASAGDFWNKTAAQGLRGAGPPSQIDWLEVPNELEDLPNWYNDPAAANWWHRFGRALRILCTARATFR